MSDEPFVNRRGHSMAAKDEDTAEPSVVTPAPVAVARPARRRRRSLYLSRWQKRGIVLALVAVIVLPVVAGEYVRWTYLNEVTTVKNKVATVFATVVQHQASQVTSKTLTEDSAKLATLGDDLCAGGLFDNIATLYPRSKQAYEACNTYRTGLTSLTTQVKEAASQMAYLEQLQPLLSGVTQPLPDHFAVLTAQQENWQTFVDGLKRLSVPASFKTSHDSLLLQAEAVRDGWIALVQASNAYDSAGFSAARVKLTAGYAALQKQAESFTSAVAAQQTTLSQVVSALKK